jgi:hypothetical protein
MAFFKRVEVWVLLVLTIGGVIAVLRMDNADDPGGSDRGTNTRQADKDGSPDRQGSDKDQPASRPNRNEIAALELERDGEHAVIEILVRTNANGQTAVKAPAKKPRLLRTDGSEVAEFFVPFQSGESESESDRNLLFWADPSTIAGALFLEIEGERLKVKDADDFDLHAINDGGRKKLSVAPSA